MVTCHLLRLSHDKLLPVRTVGSALYDVATSSKGPSSNLVIIVTVHTEYCGSVGLRVP
jgi:hypothetical protein